ncbi:MAG TPA: M1 family peptidase, partial [Flavisolibacter sp.]|nr:M1 family peptidase [Flavisolibacter sp.]
WFYSTDLVDISLDSVKVAKAATDADIPAGLKEKTETVQLARPSVNVPTDISRLRNLQDPNIRFQTDVDTSLRDFYWKYDRGIVPYDSSVITINVPAQAEKLDAATREKLQNKFFYELSFSNKGGLPMPIIIEWTYKDGSKEVERIPAQVWRHNENNVTKFFAKDKPVTAIRLDPMRETADIDESNNGWGATASEPSRLQVFKMKQGAGRGQSTGINPMQKAGAKGAF